MQVSKEASNDGGPQMTSMEGLGDIGRRELDDLMSAHRKLSAVIQLHRSIISLIRG